MAAPTNPFAAALNSNKNDNEESLSSAQYQHPHNPFAPATSAPSAATDTSSAYTSSANNPFAQSATAAYTIPDQYAQTSGQFGTNQYESANEISQQLSGLDFANTPAPSSSNRQQVSDFTSPSFNSPVRNTASKDSPVSSPYQQPESQPTDMAAAMYAPLPGPPPGQHSNAYPNFGQQQQDPPLASNQIQMPFEAVQQPAMSNGAATKQTDSDEAFARQLLADDEARIMQGRRGGRQQSRNGDYSSRGKTRAQPPNSTGAATRPDDPNEEKQWNTKEIYWQSRLQRIIIQNENGPCSLIALCNVLLLCGTLQITPEDRPAVSYSYLSSLLGEHLIDAISTSVSSNTIDLEAALSILPQTQYGLDVNVCFNSIFGFSVDEGEPAYSSLVDVSGSASNTAPALPNAEKQKQKGELALFKLCNVPFVHGWLADEDDKETWAAVVKRSGDYDKALDRVVAGDEIAKGGVVESQQNGKGSSGFADDSLPSDQALLVKDAILIRNFLEATATQLTYPGLYALSTQLKRGTPYALFRNSHISVLYRPTEEELQRAAESLDPASSAAQPQLYQLVTDSTLENEDGIVWESVEDVDGSASRFYDGKFHQATPSQDFLNNEEGIEQGQTGEDADFAYAQQLQDQESSRARRQYRQPSQGGARRQNLNRPGAPPPGGSQIQTGGSGGGMSLISRMLAGRKSNKQKTQTFNTDARTNAYPQMSDSTGLTEQQQQRDSPEPPTDPSIDRLMNEQRRSDRQRYFNEADRSNFYPLSNDINGLTLPSNNQGDSPSAGQNTTAPGQEYTQKKEKWFKKLF